MNTDESKPTSSGCVHTNARGAQEHQHHKNISGKSTTTQLLSDTGLLG